MGTVLFSAIIATARLTLLDPTPGKTFTDARLLQLGNEALSRMAMLKPEIYTIQGPIPMVAGREQRLPTTGSTRGTAAFKLIRNVVSKIPVNQVSESLLIEEQRWSAAPTEEVDVDSYSIDARDTTRFTVDPPNNGSGSVVALYGGVPEMATVGTAIPIDDTYQIALKWFLLAEAYTADTTRQDLSKTQQYTAMGMQALGIESQSKAAVAAKLGKPGGQ